MTSRANTVLVGTKAHRSRPRHHALFTDPCHSDLSHLFRFEMTSNNNPIIIIFFLLCSTSNRFTEVNCDCTEGFMDYDLLEQKASQIGTANGAATLSSNTLSMSTERYYLMPSLKFSCSGTISGFLLGVNVKIGQDRDMFPNVTLYFNERGNMYSRVLGSSRMIQIEANVFSSSGVYEYQLSNHLNFNENDVLGIYQPPSEQSVVELFYQPSPDDIFFTVSNPMTIQTRGNNRLENRRVLLHPITSKLLLHEKYNVGMVRSIE